MIKLKLLLAALSITLFAIKWHTATEYQMLSDWAEKQIDGQVNFIELRYNLNERLGFDRHEIPEKRRLISIDSVYQYPTVALSSTDFLVLGYSIAMYKAMLKSMIMLGGTSPLWPEKINRELPINPAPEQRLVYNPKKHNHNLIKP